MIKVIQSTQENKWIENTNMKDGASYYRFDITGEKQTVNGFGGAFNEIGWDALHNASESIREEILDALFSEEGTAFTVGRIPIGASDFALSWYSLCDEPEDYELTSFSIERDKNCLIPYIKEAQKRQPDMWFHASPWSPPVWMKTPQRYNGGTINKDSRTLESYANYFKKFVEAYDEEGIHVSRLFPQNEPSFEMNYPTSIFYGKDMAGFIKNYLGPLFEAKGIDTELWMGTCCSPYDAYGNREGVEHSYDNFANIALLDKEARKYIKGIGYQWGGKHSIARTRASWPDIELMQTENECGYGDNSWEYADYIFDQMWTYFTYGVTSYTYWNMILKEGGYSTWGWKQNAMITLEGDQVTYNPEFYLMKHFSHFIKSGAKHLSSQGTWSGNALAFRNPDGQTVIVAVNALDMERPMTVSENGNDVTIQIQLKTFNTILIS